MDHLPTVIGLMICEQVVVEKGTDNLSLINCFTRWKLDYFPTGPVRFCVVALMTDGYGTIPMEIIVKRLDIGEEVFHRSFLVEFGDRLQEVRFLYRVSDCTFPEAGLYDFLLLSQGEILAQHRVQIG